jgi:hypothetical protein
MPKKPGTNPKGEFAFFNVVYEDRHRSVAATSMPRPVRGIDPAWLERIPPPTSAKL